MKNLKFIPLFLILFSCNPIFVHSDYEKDTDFSKYKTFAYFKNGIDKLEISTLDKKRILRSIDEQMLLKGFVKAEQPDFLISIFTKAREDVNVNQFNNGWGMGMGWGWGFNNFGFGNQMNVSTQVQSTLFIDFLDAKTNELIWQGEGENSLPKDPRERDETVKKIVTKILLQYPPTDKK
jgi:hypothetical protein